MEDGAAFALVAKPGALAVAPGAAAVDEVEYRGSVFLVEFLDFGEAGFDHLVIPRGILLLVGGSIANQSVVEVLPFGTAETMAASAVDVAEVIDLQHPHQFFDLGAVLEDGGHDDHGGVFVGNEAVLELEFESAAGVVQFAE